MLPIQRVYIQQGSEDKVRMGDNIHSKGVECSNLGARKMTQTQENRV